MKFKNFIKNIVGETKKYIEKYEQYKELTGEEKKKRVDDLVAYYIETMIDHIGLNFVYKFIAKKLFIENVPVITQCVFDLIETKVDGITDFWTKDKK